MRRGYDPNYGSREQLADCHKRGMELARERDQLLKDITKMKWDLEQHKLLLVCMRHFMNCDGANDCATCIATADMYVEYMA